MTARIAFTIMAIVCLMQAVSCTYPGLHGTAFCPDCAVPYAAGIGAGYAVESAIPYSGPITSPVVLPTGYLADTSDVVAVRGAHLSALATAQALPGSYAAGYVATVVPPTQPPQRYTGPQASPVVLSSGYLADTSDVTAARGAHLAAVATSAGNAAVAPGETESGASGSDNGDVYNGPATLPVVLPSGYIADTRDVSAARGAYLAAVSRTPTTRPGGQKVQVIGLRQLISPVVPAVPSRYIADTHEISVTRGSHVSAQTGCDACVNSGY